MNALDFAWRWPIVWACYGLGHLASLLDEIEPARALYQRLMGWSHQLDKYEVCWVTYNPEGL